jgi:hypothetical protein
MRKTQLSALTRSNTEEATPQKQPAGYMLSAREADFGFSWANLTPYQTGSKKLLCKRGNTT